MTRRQGETATRGEALPRPGITVVQRLRFWLILAVVLIAAIGLGTRTVLRGRDAGAVVGYGESDQGGSGQ